MNRGKNVMLPASPRWQGVSSVRPQWYQSFDPTFAQGIILCYTPAAARPGPSNFERMGRGPARLIKVSKDGPRPGPAHQNFRVRAAARPSPSQFQFLPARPGLAHQFFKRLGPARPGPSQFSDRPGPARPRQTSHGKP